MIRLLHRDDIQTCKDIFYKSIESTPYDVEKELKQQFIDSILKPEFYVFEEDSIIKGFWWLSNCRFDDQVYSLGICYVLPEFQWQWIWKKLTHHRIDRIKKLWWVIIFSTTGKPRHLERFWFKEIDSPYSNWHLMQLVIK